MPYETAGATPRNMGTQCENIYESAREKYFGLGVRTSDPLLNVVKWIAYITEIGAAIVVAVALICYFLVVICFQLGLIISKSFDTFMISAIISLAVGLVAFCYLHFIWWKPSSHLLLGIQQLSALKFLPWILTAFIHSIPSVYFHYFYMTERTYSYPYGRNLRTDLTCWHWVIGSMVWVLILTPQFVVLAAVVRVRRLNNERRRIESPSLLTGPQVGAFQNIASPTTTSLQLDVPSRAQYVCLPISLDIPETSQDDLEDLPPSYSMAVLQDPPEYSET